MADSTIRLPADSTGSRLLTHNKGTGAAGSGTDKHAQSRGLCQCGCGEETSLIPKNRPRRGHVKGQPYRFLPNHHRRGSNPVGDQQPCSRCGEWKYLSAFYERQGSERRRSECIECHQARCRWNSLRRKYNITEDEYDSMLLAQGGLCAVCVRRSPTDVDHCHASGRIRGLLCKQCNFVLGLMDDNAQALRQAANYIEEHYGE